MGSERVPLPNETLVRKTEDVTFGPIELWRWRSGDGPLMLEWRGSARLDDGSIAGVIINIEKLGAEETALVLLNAAERQTFEGLTQSSEGVRLNAARGLLRTAHDWCESSGRSPPTLEAFAASLKVREFVLDTDAEGVNISVWFDDTADYFAGHGLYATYDGEGTQLDVALFG